MVDAKTIKLRPKVYAELLSDRLKRRVSIEDALDDLLSRAQRKKPSDFAGGWVMSDEEDKEIKESLNIEQLRITERSDLAEARDIRIHVILRGIDATSQNFQPSRFHSTGKLSCCYANLHLSRSPGGCCCCSKNAAIRCKVVLRKSDFMSAPTESKYFVRSTFS